MLDKAYLVRPITFERIEAIWRTQLWPYRKSAITPVSSMLFLGGNDVSLHQKSAPRFYGLFFYDELIGVNSGFASSDRHWRSRGLWISSRHRDLGLSRLLLNLVIADSRKEGKEIVWSFPRKTSLFAYESVGFQQCSEWNDEAEFGPNCYVSLTVNN